MRCSLRNKVIISIISGFIITIWILSITMTLVISINNSNEEEGINIINSINNPLVYQYKVYYENNTYKSINILFRGNGIINFINENSQDKIEIKINRDYFEYIEAELDNFGIFSINETSYSTKSQSNFSIFYWSPISYRAISLNSLDQNSNDELIKILFLKLEEIYKDIYINYSI